jgi:hypothetical protein
MPNMNTTMRNITWEAYIEMNTKVEREKKLWPKDQRESSVNQESVGIVLLNHKNWTEVMMMIP